MQNINGIASIEIEQNLIDSVQDLDLQSVTDLLYRFSFSEEVLKDLSIDILQKNIDLDRTNIQIALLLMNKTGKQTKEDFLNYIKETEKALFQHLHERIDL